MTFDELVETSLLEACQSLVPSPRQSSGASDETFRFAAVIGYSGDNVRGTLGVSATASGIERLCVHNGLDTDLQFGDALGELANHLLGRVKRSFDRYEVSISISTPIALRAVSIEVCSTTELRREFLSEQDGDRILVWIDSQPDADLRLAESPTDDDWISSDEPLLF